MHRVVQKIAQSLILRYFATLCNPKCSEINW